MSETTALDNEPLPDTHRIIKDLAQSHELLDAEDEAFESLEETLTDIEELEAESDG